MPSTSHPFSQIYYEWKSKMWEGKPWMIKTSDQILSTIFVSHHFLPSVLKVSLFWTFESSSVALFLFSFSLRLQNFLAWFLVPLLFQDLGSQILMSETSLHVLQVAPTKPQKSLLTSFETCVEDHTFSTTLAWKMAQASFFGIWGVWLMIQALSCRCCSCIFVWSRS